MNISHLRRMTLRLLLCLLVLVVGAVGVLLWDGLSDEIARSDVALVLGNTVNPDGTPSARVAARLDRALELYRQGSFAHVIVSGAVGKEGHDEAVVMRDYLSSRGVLRDQIVVDSHGYTTFDSARNTKQIMAQHQFRSVLVISQYFHIPRAKLALRRFGIPSVGSAHARHFEARDLYSIPRELIGFVRYWFRTYEKGEQTQQAFRAQSALG